MAKEVRSFGEIGQDVSDILFAPSPLKISTPNDFTEKDIMFLAGDNQLSFLDQLSGNLSNNISKVIDAHGDRLASKLNNPKVVTQLDQTAVLPENNAPAQKPEQTEEEMLNEKLKKYAPYAVGGMAALVLLIAVVKR